MPYAHKTSQPTKNALRRGDLALAVNGEQNLGPTSATGYYNTLRPPTSGYAIYSLGLNNNPIVMTVTTDDEIIRAANTLGGSVSSESDALVYLAGRSSTWILQNMPNNIVTDGLVLALNAGLVSSYPRSGTDWYDLSGEANDGILTNGVTFNSEGYMDFDGDDDYVAISSYTFGNGDWAVSAWVNADVVDNYNLLSNISGGPVTNAFGFDNNKIHYRNYDGSWQTHYGNTTLSSGEWYHLTWVNYRGGTAEEGTMKMYVNGVADSSVFNSYTTNGGPCDVIGRNWTTTEYDGKIANIKFYTESLTDEEALQNYYGAPNIPSGAKIIVNRAQNGVTIDSSGIELDLAQVYNNTQTWGYANSDLNGDFDDLTNFTYCLWLHCYSHHTNYSQTSFYKYAGTTTAVIRLYDFGNYNGGTAGANNRFYANRGGSWGSISGNFTMAVGETAFICLQYDSINGGDLWKNGVKISTGTGSGTIATNTSNLGIITPEYGGEQYVKVKEAYVYTSTLTDTQVLDLYTSTKLKYNV